MALLDNLKWFILLVVAIAILAAYGSLSLQLVPWSSIYLELAPRLGVSLLLIVLGKVALELTTPFIESFAHPFETRGIARKLWRYSLWLLTAFAILSVLLGDFTAFSIAIALVIIGIVFSLRHVLVNFAGWLLIKSKNYYSLGDNVRVGKLAGKVLRVDLMETTLLQKTKSVVNGAPYSGRIVKIPNARALTEAIIVNLPNLPYVWDSVTIRVTYNSDYSSLKKILLKASDEVIGNKKMAENIKEYKHALQAMGVDHGPVPEGPEVFLSFQDDCASVTLSYFIQERARRDMRTALLEKIWSEARKKKKIKLA